MGRAWGCLQQRSDFLKAAGQGLRRGTPAFLMQAIRQVPDSDTQTHAHQIRVGFTATRKLGNAVVRNRAKRRLRAAADAVLPAFSHQAIDVVLIARPDCLSRTFSHMTDELRRATEHMIRQLSPAPPPAPQDAP